MPIQKNRILIKTHKLDDTIAKGENSGKIGLFIDKKPIPDLAKQGDFPMNPRIKTLRAKFPVRDKVISKNKYEQVKFKENQTQLSGKESKIIDNFEYDGKKPFVYNPFTAGAGSISEVGGYNQGGDDDFSNIKHDNEIMPEEFELTKKFNDGIKKVIQPEKEPPILNPREKRKTRIRIK